MKAGIYYIRNKLNNKYYVGQSENVERRLKAHKREYLYNSSYIHNTMKDIGIDNFEFNIITRCKKEELDDLEIKYIKEYNSYYLWDNGGYNKTLGGKKCDGVVISEEQKQWQSKIMKGRYIGENNPNYNNRWKEEQKEKQSENHIGLQSGGNNGMSKKVIIDDKVFECVEDCAKFLNIPYARLTTWLNGRSTMPVEYYVLGLRYENKNMNEYKVRKNNYDGMQDKQINNKGYSKPVICNGIEYESATQCLESLKLKVDISTLCRWCKNNKAPKHTGIYEIYYKDKKVKSYGK